MIPGLVAAASVTGLLGLVILGWLTPEAGIIGAGIGAVFALTQALVGSAGRRNMARAQSRLARQWTAAASGANDALQAARRDHAHLLDMLPAPVIILRADRVPLLANRAARSLLGPDMAALLRHPALVAALDAPSAGDTAIVIEMGLAGSVARLLRANVVRLEPASADAGQALVLLTDHSAEQATLRMRTDFVANASHELRTPLTALIGFIDTLRGPAADDPAAQARFLAIMAEQSARMARLIDDLLSLSRLEMTEHQAPVEPVALLPMLERVAAGFDVRLAERGMRLEKDFRADVPLVTGDADQLAQVVQNLLDNAVKYGRDQGVVRLGVRLAAGGAGWPARAGVLITVADDGIGIARVHLPRLSERFYRVDAGRSRAVGGTGLGLAIVKHIVNRHRGLWRVESEEGKGTTVTIWLPEPAATAR